MTDRVCNVFQTVTGVAVLWLFVGLLIWSLGCAAPAPVMMKPDIVEIEVPRAVLTPFDCQCQCEPHKALEIEVDKEADPWGSIHE